MSKRPIGRPKTRWEDDVLEDIKSINICNWKKVAQNRDSWKKWLSKPEPYIGCSALYEDIYIYKKVLFLTENSVSIIKACKKRP